MTQFLKIVLFLKVLGVIAPGIGLCADTQTAFLADLGKIRPSMSKLEVENFLGAYKKGTNWPYTNSKTAELMGTSRGTFEVDTSKTKELAFKNCDVYRHSDEAEYNADWGIVCYEEGKVVHVDFAPD